MPTDDQIAICIQGGRFAIEQDESIHHQIETVDDEPFKYYAINQSMRHGRLEMLFDDWDGYDDFEDWPVALWVDRGRDEIIQKNDDALSTE